MPKKSKNENKHSNAEKLISLKPYEFDEAVSDLLKVKPQIKEDKPEKSDKPQNMSESI
jgi:hypothetical protein